MKKKFNITAILCAWMIGLCAVGMTACSDDANDWPVDPEDAGLFRPLTFEKGTVTATTVQLTYSKVMKAKKYLFEFYTDSLLFVPEHLVRVDTILADTLTVFADNSSPMRIQYRTIFPDLVGSTQYSVRMRGIDNTGLESGYVSVDFQTSAEQLFTDIEKTLTTATVFWTQTPNVTHLSLYKQSPETKLFEELEQIDLTAADIEKATKTLTDLQSGTNYKVRIYNGENIRGELAFKTMGLANSETIEVSPADDLTAILEDCSDRKVTALTLVFESGSEYTLGDVKLPASLENVIWAASSTDEDRLPHIILKTLALEAEIQSLGFEYVDLDVQGQGSHMLTIKSTSASFKSISFEKCIVENVPRSVIRLDVAGLRIDDIVFNNSTLRNIGTGGYGLFTMGKDAEILNNFSITNCTLIGMGDQLMDAYGGLKSVLLENCTFYNDEPVKELGRVFRFRKDPEKVTVRNTIFSGKNKGKKIDAGASSYKYLNFADNNYMTSDLVENSKKFEGINKLDFTSDDLFVDPQHGDFHIKPGAGFAGTGVAGDPKWF